LSRITRESFAKFFDYVIPFGELSIIVAIPMSPRFLKISDLIDFVHPKVLTGSYDKPR